ncbi:hypothetical protein [Natronincola ferrireducens]|uniref:Uncharacterized protein n=1 Tax=Natronincola ferrireducens TaxID=393762 RepID=A0A1G9GKH3_9FIRM|nr:hypothetical protein [Natronincola ferrireducens]SDL01190.1 hypothetical protein SAMN05660472_02455 [Natronincola ferrireducens]
MICKEIIGQILKEDDVKTIGDSYSFLKNLLKDTLRDVGSRGRSRLRLC